MSMCSWETKMFDTRADLPLPYLLPLRFRLSPPSAVGDPVRPSDNLCPRNTTFRLLEQRQRVIRQHRRLLMHLSASPPYGGLNLAHRRPSRCSSVVCFQSAPDLFLNSPFGF